MWFTHSLLRDKCMKHEKAMVDPEKESVVTLESDNDEIYQRMLVLKLLIDRKYLNYLVVKVNII